MQTLTNPMNPAALCAAVIYRAIHPKTDGQVDHIDLTQAEDEERVNDEPEGETPLDKAPQ